MKPRLWYVRRGAVSAVAACSLAMALGVAPIPALAQDQPAEDETYQEVVDQEAVVEETQSVDATEEQVAVAETASDETPVSESEGTEPTEAAEEPAVTDEQASSDETVMDVPVADDTEEQPVEVEVEAAQDAVVEGDEAATEEQVAEADATATDEPATVEDETISVLSDPSAFVADGDYIIEAGIETSDKTGLVSLVLDQRGGVAQEGAKIISWKYTGKDNQKWHVTQDSSGWYVISAFADHSLVLTATNDSGRLYLTKYVSGLASQLWAFLLSGTSYGTGYQLTPQGIQKSAKDATIVSVLPNKAIDVRGNSKDNGAEIITYTKSTTPKGNQTYYLVNPNPTLPTSGVTNMEGKYRVKVPSTSVVVEIRKATSDNGANVWLYTSSGKSHQDVYLQHEGNGFYSLWVMGTKKVLDVRGSSILPGTNIIQWAYKGTDNQKWAVRKNADGTYSFINKATGLVLGAASENKGASGNNIAGAQDDGRANNNFTLTRMALITSGMYKIKEASGSKVLDVSKSSTSNGASIGFYTDNGGKNQRFELISAGGTDLWRIRTASSGGWVTYIPGKGVSQQGNHATAIDSTNTWQVLWRNGNYMLVSGSNKHALGGGQKQVTFVSAPITIKEGLFEIDGKLSGVALDIPGSSKAAGTKVNVYKDNNGVNQKFIIEKYGTGYKIINLNSGLAVTASGSADGSKVTQQSFSGAATQVWTIGIADGGYIKLINKSTKSALDISGTDTIASNKSTATQVYTASGDREDRQSWKMTGASGWAKFHDVTVYFNSAGTQVTTSPQAWVLYNQIKNMSSATKYLIAIYPDNPRFVIFQGSKGNWVPIRDWECGTGAPEEDGKSRSLRGAWKLGDGHGEEEEGGDPLTEEAAVYGKSAVLPGYSGCTYGYFINGKWAIHSTMPGVPESQQVNRLVSHGCIRLRLANAKWVYYNMPRWTRVWSVPRVVPSDITYRLSTINSWANVLYQ